MPSKETLLDSIRPGMRLTRDFFLRVYGYSVTDPGFAEVALERLEAAGCDHADEHYEKTVSEWQAAHDAMMNRAAAEYRQQVIEKNEVEQWRKIDSMTEAEAKALLKRMMH